MSHKKKLKINLKNDLIKRLQSVNNKNTKDRMWGINCTIWLSSLCGGTASGLRITGLRITCRDIYTWNEIHIYMWFVGLNCVIKQSSDVQKHACLFQYSSYTANHRDNCPFILFLIITRVLIMCLVHFESKMVDIFRAGRNKVYWVLYYKRKLEIIRKLNIN